VLEIGCGDGGNLIPLAVAHPRSHFVGVDLAPVHIETARKLTAELELGNVELFADSFVGWGAGQAPFDYVIAHGLLSWVTPALQDRLLDACAKLLSPRGVAFVSYNTHPGWAMQHSIREVMRHHTRGVADIEEAVARARTLLDVLIATVPGREAAYREHLQSIGAVARDPARRHYFAHEYLESENHPFYVRDFVERAAAHGLVYVADADLVDCELDNMPDEPRSRLAGLADDGPGRLQMLDFVVNRKFRQSLLVHQRNAPLPEPDWRRISRMYVTSALATDDPTTRVAGPGTMQFADRHGRTLELDQPVAKAALIRFVEDSAQPIAFDDLLEWAWRRAGARPRPGSEEESAERMLVALVFGRLLSAGMAEVQASPPAWALEPGDRPRASVLARRAARLGAPTASLRHRSVALDNEAVCAVLARLDGTRDRTALARELAGQVGPSEIGTILDLAAQKALLLP
jgi:SAM-dependent methyltransferase